MKAKEIRKILNEALKEHGYSEEEILDLKMKQVLEILQMQVVRKIKNINLN